jgi:hypothetical protein
MIRRTGHEGARRGWPAWAQIGVGCGAALLVLLATLAGGGYLVYRRGTQVMDRAWRDLRKTAERLQTPESTHVLFRTNPALTEIYPTEKDFMKAVETWRPRLGTVPAQCPPLQAIFRDPELIQVHQNRSDGHETIRIRYRFPSGAVLLMETDQGRLTNLLLQ